MYKKEKEDIKLVGILFGLLWIICWFTACWVFHLQLFFTGLFALILAVFLHEKDSI